MRPYVFLVIEAKQKIFSPCEISHFVGQFIFRKYMAKLNGWGMGDNFLCTDYLKHPVQSRFQSRDCQGKCYKVRSKRERGMDFENEWGSFSG